MPIRKAELSEHAFPNRAWEPQKSTHTGKENHESSLMADARATGEQASHSFIQDDPLAASGASI
jgi:hypothetical protein